jgi:hypothetical protein
MLLTTTAQLVSLFASASVVRYITSDDVFLLTRFC